MTSSLLWISVYIGKLVSIGKHFSENNLAGNIICILYFPGANMSNLYLWFCRQARVRLFIWCTNFSYSVSNIRASFVSERRISILPMIYLVVYTSLPWTSFSSRKQITGFFSITLNAYQTLQYAYRTLHNAYQTLHNAYQLLSLTLSLSIYIYYINKK
jgi:hypothetical protein